YRDLDRSGDRSAVAWDDAADRHRDRIFGAQRARDRSAAGWIRSAGAAWHSGPAQWAPRRAGFKVSEAVLEVKAVSKRFGGFAALSQVSLAVSSGERLGIIGPNGSGKTTLINCICGALRTDQGAIRFYGTDITRLPGYRRNRLGLARSFQIPRPFVSM